MRLRKLVLEQERLEFNHICLHLYVCTKKYQGQPLLGGFIDCFPHAVYCLLSRKKKKKEIIMKMMHIFSRLEEREHNVSLEKIKGKYQGRTIKRSASKATIAHRGR